MTFIFTILLANWQSLSSATGIVILLRYLLPLTLNFICIIWLIVSWDIIILQLISHQSAISNDIQYVLHALIDNYTVCIFYTYIFCIVLEENDNREFDVHLDFCVHQKFYDDHFRSIYTNWYDKTTRCYSSIVLHSKKVQVCNQVKLLYDKL